MRAAPRSAVVVARSSKRTAETQARGHFIERRADGDRRGQATRPAEGADLQSATCAPAAPRRLVAATYGRWRTPPEGRDRPGEEGGSSTLTGARGLARRRRRCATAADPRTGQPPTPPPPPPGERRARRQPPAARLGEDSRPWGTGRRRGTFDARWKTAAVASGAARRAARRPPAAPVRRGDPPAAPRAAPGGSGGDACSAEGIGRPNAFSNTASNPCAGGRRRRRDARQRFPAAGPRGLGGERFGGLDELELGLHRALRAAEARQRRAAHPPSARRPMEMRRAAVVATPPRAPPRRDAAATSAEGKAFPRGDVDGGRRRRREWWRGAGGVRRRTSRPRKSGERGGG